MIDAHCHLEQNELYLKLDELIPKWKRELNFVISSCAHANDIDKTMEISRKFSPFVKICVGLHPEFIKGLKDEEILRVEKFIRKNFHDIVAIGEIGLDYHWVKEPGWQNEQKKLFIRLIRLGKELNLPLVIHSRAAVPDAIFILEQEHMKNHKILFHFLEDKDCIKKIVDNNWIISIGPSILRSKDIKKIARDMPIERILLETDSPWFAQKPEQVFGEPINVKLVCEKIAEIKHMSPAEVEKQTDKNAIEFFKLRD